MNAKNPSSKKEEKLVAFKQTQFYTVLTMLAFAAGILVGYFIWGTNPPAAPALAAAVDQAPVAMEEAPQTGGVFNIPTEGYPSIGPEDAAITLIEFSDFGCSFCAKWHNEAFQALMDAYPDQIRFVYRDVPFRAFPASEAAWCAKDQGLFWEYHDKLFSYEYGLDDNAYVQYAQDLNLDMDDFNTCMSEHRYKASIQADLEFATSQLGINSTPTFFINGTKLIGAQPISVFMQAIDAELAK